MENPTREGLQEFLLGELSLFHREAFRYDIWNIPVSDVMLSDLDTDRVLGDECCSNHTLKPSAPVQNY